MNGKYYQIKIGNVCNQPDSNTIQSRTIFKCTFFSRSHCAELFFQQKIFVSSFIFSFILLDCRWSLHLGSGSRSHIDLSQTVIAGSMTEMSIRFKLRHRLMLRLLESIPPLLVSGFATVTITRHRCWFGAVSTHKTKRMKKRWMKTETSYNGETTWLKVRFIHGCNAKIPSFIAKLHFGTTSKN